MASILRQRRDTAANWALNDPIINDGQLCFDTTNNTYRIGNGSDNYSGLPIQSGAPGANGADGANGTDGIDGTLSGLLGTDLDCNGFTVNKSGYRQIPDATPADTGTQSIDYGQGDLIQVLCPANLSLAFNNFPTGDVAAMLVDLVNGGSSTITYPVGTLFAAGTAPTLTAAGTDRILVSKDKDEAFLVSVVALDFKVSA